LLTEKNKTTCNVDDPWSRSQSSKTMLLLTTLILLIENSFLHLVDTIQTRIQNQDIVNGVKV